MDVIQLMESGPVQTLSTYAACVLTMTSLLATFSVYIFIPYVFDLKTSGMIIILFKYPIISSPILYHTTGHYTLIFFSF